MATLKGGTYVGGDLTVATNLYANVLKSCVAVGTSPLTVVSTTLVTNLNADMLDGYHASASPSANTVVLRDVNGYIQTGYINTTAGVVNTGASNYFFEQSNDGYIRKKSLADVKTEIVTSAAVIAGLTYTPYNATNPGGYTSNVGTVTSVAAITLGTTGTDLSSTVAGGTTAAVITLNVPTASAANRGVLSTTDWTNFSTAYTDRLKWDGGSTGLTASTGRTSLGATTVGTYLFTLVNPSAITFLRVNADNTVSTLDAATFRGAIGAGTSSTTGTVTSVAALTLGTTGTDVSSSVAGGTAAAVITLNLPTSSSANRGLLSAADWSTFNGKTNNTGTVTSITAGTGLSGGAITTSGTIAVNYGSTSTTSCVGNDSRLADTRTPTDSTVLWGKVGANLKSSTTVTSSVDLSAYGIGNITLGANTAFTFSGYELNKTYMLIITANGFTPSWAVGARHIPVTGNEVFGTTGVFYVSLTCIDSTSGSEKLLTMIMKGA